MYMKSKNIVLPDGEKALVLSDLHLGLGNSNFDREKTILNHLLNYKKMYRFIILNGDVFETWKYGGAKWDVSSRLDKIDEIINKIPGLREFLYRSDVLLIHGNHDYVLTKYTNDPHIVVHSEINVISTNKQYHIEHGNNADPKYNNAYMKKSISKRTVIFDYIYNMILNLLAYLGYINNSIEVDSKITDVLFVTKLVDDAIFDDYAKTFNEFDVVIFGHTHETANKDLGVVKYINSGDQLVQLEGCVISNSKDYLIKRKY